MKQRTWTILNDPDLLQKRNEWFDKLKLLYEGKLENQIFYLNGMYGHSVTNPYEEPEKWLDEALDDLAQHADKLMDQNIFRPLCIEFGPYGVHFIDKIFGARVYLINPADSGIMNISKVLSVSCNIQIL